MELNCRSAARAAAAQNYFPTKYEIPGCNGNCRNIFMWFCGSIRTANTRTNQFRILPQICLCRPKKYTPKTYLRQPRKVAKIGHFFVKNRDSFERRFSTPSF